MKAYDVKYVPHLVYYKTTHPAVAGANNRVEAPGFTQHLWVPGNTLVSAMYRDLQPWHLDAHLQVVLEHPTHYEQRGGDTAEEAEVKLCSGSLPAPQLGMIMLG